MKVELQISIKTILRQYLFAIIDWLAVTGKKGVSTNTLLLVRVDAIGDYVLFRNFIKKIRESKKYKSYRIVLCGNIAWRDIAVAYDSQLIDSFIWVDKRRMVRNILYRFKILTRVRKINANVTFNPVYSRDFFSGDSIVNASNAGVKVGCVTETIIQTPRQLKKSNGYYTSLIKTPKATIFEFIRNKIIVEKFLEQPIELKKPYFEKKWDPGKISLVQDKEQAIVINPSAGAINRRWSPAKFAELINKLYEMTDSRFVIIGGKEDQALSDQIITGITVPVKIVNLTGKTNLSQLLTVISLSKLVISNDTSSVHFSAAVDVPVVCISKGDQFGRFTEYPSECGDVATVYPPEIMRRMTDMDELYEKYRFFSPLNIDSISVDDVMKVVCQKLSI